MIYVIILKDEYVITYINDALIYLIQCVFHNKKYSHHYFCTFGFLWDKTIYDKFIYTSYDLILMKKGTWSVWWRGGFLRISQ